MERVVWGHTTRYPAPMIDAWKLGAALVCALVVMPPLAEGRVSFMQADPADLAERIDALFETWDDIESPGASVAVMRDGQMIHSAGYGCAQLEYGIPIEADTVFHVASVSKQFTAMSVALLVLDGKLDLDAELRSYVDDVPDFGTSLTLRHVLHHTSGLRDQWESLIMAGMRGDDVIRQEDILSMVRRMRELNFQPGERHLYCNTGFSLAAESVARTSGQSFPDFARARIFEPLGMRNTHVHSDHQHIVPGRAYSYSKGDDGYEKRVLSFANYGATNLFTTAPDLVLWLTNFDHGNVGGDAARELMLERGVLNNGEPIDYALGVVHGQYKGWKTISHGGADAGFRSHVVWFPEAKLAIAVLSNLDSVGPGTRAFEVANLILADESAPPSEASPEEAPVKSEAPAADPTEFEVSPDVFDRYVGHYVDRSGYGIELERTRTRLYMRRGTRGRNRLYPVAEHRFRSKSSGVEVALVHDAAGRVSGLILDIHGRSHVFTRRSTAAEPVDLKQYCGRYLCEELNAVYDIELEDGGLIARQMRQGTIHLGTSWPDEFQGDRWFFGKLRFERDDDGTLNGFRVDGSRVLNLRFTKIGAGR